MTRQINIFTWLFSFMALARMGIIDDGAGGDAGGDGDAGGSDGGQDGGGAGDSGGDGGDGGQAPNWLDGVSDELRAHPSMESIKDINGLVSSHVNAQSMIGKSIRIPGEDASNEVRAEFAAKLLAVPGVAQLPGEDDTEGWNKFYQKIGAPETGEGYEVERPDLPEGHSYDEDLQTVIHTKAAELGVSKKQLAGLMGAYWENFADQAEAKVEAAKNTIAQLKTEWGPGYDQKMGMARQIISQFGGEALSKELDESKLGNNPELSKLLSKIGEQFSEDGIIKVDSTVAETRTELEAQKGEIMGNLGHAYHVRSHPGHDAAVKKMDSLNEQLAQYK